MDLNSILKATSHKVKTLPKTKRAILHIATSDRPYDKNTLSSKSLDDKNTLIKKLKGAQLNVLTHLIYYQTNEVNLEGINTKELSKKCNTSLL